MTDEKTKDVSDYVQVDTFVLTHKDTGQFYGAFMDAETGDCDVYGPFETQDAAKAFLNHQMKKHGAVDVTDATTKPLH